MTLASGSSCIWCLSTLRAMEMSASGLWKEHLFAGHQPERTVRGNVAMEMAGLCEVRVHVEIVRYHVCEYLSCGQTPREIAVSCGLPNPPDRAANSGSMHLAIHVFTALHGRPTIILQRKYERTESRRITPSTADSCCQIDDRDQGT